MPGPARRPMLERLWARVERGGPDDCWPWQGSITPAGYGQINAGGKYGKRLAVHRVVYESEVGPIPDGHDMDHLCENKVCCNPAHLEPVTRQDNMLRFHGQRTTCKYGHPLDGLVRARTPQGNWSQQRFCRTCANARTREARRKRVASER